MQRRPQGKMNALLPSFSSLTLPQVLAMDLRGFHLSRKMDGRTAQREMLNAVFVGEQMANGDFWAFDLKQIGTHNISGWSKQRRWTMLCSFRDRVKIVPHGTGAEFVEAVFADPTAEGIVGADWQSPFGYDIFKCKRVETFDVRVTEKLRGAIAIEYENQSAGKVALSGQNYELVQPGMVVEIAAANRNASGKFREPRFIRIRYDKV